MESDAKSPNENVLRVEAWHQDCPIALSYSPNGEEGKFAYLDLGKPGDLTGSPMGPRIAVRRLRGNQTGWRILIHPDGDDPVKAFEILDAVGNQPPEVIEENCD